MNQYVLVILIAGACCALVGVGAIIRHHHRERARLTRYTLRGQGEPQSIVCPKCARRSYSESAIRDRYCPACKTHHDAPARAGSVQSGTPA
ncbi:hypothetical protein [Sphingomonas nostoxanthinifaciens]|uniref:hypothetical protein n=1 Tax=Sphingomonas nostoxanthinifaciens TaxID=2872652 RepID=UPI001CC1D14D|nr:hypothetical protein [Sphingomonas nostoxanthinifaciens]UAK23328.1 hypothetical protein K8P63_13075 [Sphingomonas nostoxanthinifaciens]